MTPRTTTPNSDLAREADDDAEEYLRSLTLEHFVEAPPQATQRKITVVAFDLIAAARPDVQCFSELLIQYPRPRRKKLGRVVPDNVVFVHPERLEVPRSYDLREQPARPFLAAEYVSKANRRKDYEDNYDIYQDDLGVPYYLLYYPDNEELTLFRLADGVYQTVGPNEAGRLPVPELELEVDLLDGWARYWFRGELLPVPAEWQEEMAATRAELAAEREARMAADQRADAERQRADAAEAENARLRALLAERGS